jgi:hypothetical protein
MADIGKKLIHRVLKQVRHKLDWVDHTVDELKSEMNAFRGHMISLQQDTHKIDGVLGRHDAFFKRTERRLELSDAPNLT